MDEQKNFLSEDSLEGYIYLSWIRLASCHAASILVVCSKRWHSGRS